MKKILTIIICLSILSFPLNIFASLVDAIDYATDDDLNGKGTWTPNSGNGCKVRSSGQSGNMVVCLDDGNSDAAEATFSAEADGNQVLHFKADVDYGIIAMLRTSDGETAIKTQIDDPNCNELDEWCHYNGTSYEFIASISNGVWYKAEIEYETAGDTANYRLGQSTYGDNWTAVSPSWIGADSAFRVWTTLDTVIVGISATGDNGDMNFDTFEDPNAGEPAVGAGRNQKIINTNSGFGW